MRVLRTALLWYEHEAHHHTEANWSKENIFVVIAHSTDDMMSHHFIRDRDHMRFISIDDVNEPIAKYSAVEDTRTGGSDVVTVAAAAIRDVTTSTAGFDGTVGSLRSELLSPPDRYVSLIIQNFIQLYIWIIDHLLSFFVYCG